MPRRYDLSALNGFQLLSPAALGGPADYFGDDNYWETVFSIGFVPLVLAAIAVLRHGERRLVRGWLVLVGLAVWFACGRNLGLYALVYATVPGMSVFRVPARSLFLAALGAAVLAGMGIDTLRRQLADLRSWRRYARRFAAVMLAVIVTLLLFQAQLNSPLSPRSAHAAGRVLHDLRFWLSVGGLTILTAVGCLRHGERWRCSAGTLAGLLAFVELSWAGYSLIQVAPPEKFLGADAVGATINRLGDRGVDTVPARIKARDTFYDDLCDRRRSGEDQHQRRLPARSRGAALRNALSSDGSPPSARGGTAHERARRPFRARGAPGDFRPHERRLPGFRPLRVRPGLAGHRQGILGRIVLRDCAIPPRFPVPTSCPPRQSRTSRPRSSSRSSADSIPANRS